MAENHSNPPSNPLCITLMSNSVTALSYKEQFSREKFVGFDFISSNTVGEFISVVENNNAKGIIIDPITIASLNPTNHERKKIVSIAKSFGCGKVQFAHFTIPNNGNVSPNELSRWRKYAYELSEELRPLIEP